MKALAFSMFAFHACLLTASVDTLSAASVSISLRFVEALFPNTPCLLWVFFPPHQRLEADLSYWMDHARASDQGRQHHYDENSPIGPRDPTSYRHGANVNYDYY